MNLYKTISILKTGYLTTSVHIYIYTYFKCYYHLYRQTEVNILIYILYVTFPVQAVYFHMLHSMKNMAVAMVLTLNAL